MKRAFTLLLVLLFCKAQAGDTLTRAQVYNFNVGDIFDYCDFLVEIYSNWQSGYITSGTTVFSRYEVINISYSADSSVEYIQRLRSFPQRYLLDTLTLQDMSGQEVFLDTSVCFSYDGGSIDVDSVSRYDNRVINQLSQALCYPGNEVLLFASGLGIVVNEQWTGGCGPCDGGTFDSTVLIYYKKGADTWGTPYFDVPFAVQETAEANNPIGLAPMINNGNFNVTVRTFFLSTISFAVYDITGRLVSTTVLPNVSSTINIPFQANGLYIWKAWTNGKLLQAGKMIIHE